MSCDETELSPDLVVDAGKRLGNYSETYTDIRAGATCSAVEDADGSTSTVDVAISGDNGTSITVPAGGLAVRHITDTYTHATGSLVVTKNIDGPAAGNQGEVKISVACGGTSLNDFVIPAGEKLPVSQRYSDIPAGSTCTVDETVDGSTSTVSVTTVPVGGSQSVPIVAGREATADITNTYEFKPGALTVEKVVEGLGAGQQGTITVTTSCLLEGKSTTLSPALVIPAGSPATTYSEAYRDIPAGSECSAHVSMDGSNAKVADLEGSEGGTAIILPGGTATIHLTDNYETGELVINKTITGPAAGLQGRVVIHTVCNGTALADFSLDAGKRDGTYNHVYTGVLAGSTCTVTETADGSSSVVDVVTGGSPQTVTISANGTATADLSDTYTEVSGSLKLIKTIWGPAAGQQGEVTIKVSCGETELLPEFVVDAGKRLGNYSYIYTGIPAGSTCSAQEIANGGSSAVSVVTSGDVGTPVSVPAGGFAYLHITDTYSHANGSLIVNKAIVGSAAGQQGEIVIEVSCDDQALEDFVIPARATGPQSKDYMDLPGGSRCSVVEVADGSTGTVAVAKKGSGTEVTIPAGAEATVDLTDTYESGTLVVNKTITGGAAGSQGEVRIAVNCDEAGVETPQPDFVIPAGTAAGTVSMSYPNVLAGSTCTLTETADGATETATAVTVGVPQEVTISENGTATANVTNTYEYVPGALIVSKDIAGPAAGQQGQISIGVTCELDGAATALVPFVIPTGQRAGIVSHPYEGIPAGSTCTVAETQDGSTATVSVETAGGNQTLAVPARDVVVANILDTYYLAPPAPGELTVTKTITGPAAGQQGAITISVTCGAAALPDFVIPGGTSAGTLARSYAGVAAGSICTVTETGNGASSTVLAVTEGSPQTVDISADGTGVANLTDTYSNAPIPVGSLTVTKDITGPAAGQQGPVTVTASCNGRALPPPLTSPRGRRASTRRLTRASLPVLFAVRLLALTAPPARSK